jgi:hypothetical protein
MNRFLYVLAEALIYYLLEITKACTPKWFFILLAKLALGSPLNPAGK